MRGPVAKRYARALLELGIEKSNYEKLQTQTRELAEIWLGSAALRAIVSNPSVSVDERRRVVEQIAAKSGWDPMIRNFCYLLLDNDRFDHVDGIADELDHMVDQHDGNVRAHVTTATELKDSQVASLKGALSKLTGKNVILETDIDPDLLGGVVARVGGTLYDGSIQAQLSTLRESILDEV